uniref:Uncharacterized protein n=1 Tax=Ditylenchus dipsaci TaxID=166011 RepID=A0A915D7K9_9BILA
MTSQELNSGRLHIEGSESDDQKAIELQPHDDEGAPVHRKRNRNNEAAKNLRQFSDPVINLFTLQMKNLKSLGVLSQTSKSRAKTIQPAQVPECSIQQHLDLQLAQNIEFPRVPSLHLSPLYMSVVVLVVWLENWGTSLCDSFF